jgi:4-diphosphocytidyl-2-C-methyl-D-erythritol kinase
MKMIHEKAYAKINIGLEIKNKREDGYHNLRTIMTSINIHDDLFMRLNDEIIVESDKDICCQEDNLVYKVALIMKNRFSVKLGAKIYIAKNIRAGAGMAGGSTDAAAAIRGLNKLWDLNLSTHEMYQIAKDIGSDVAFCLEGKTAVVEGVGDIITTIPFDIEGYIVLIYPPYTCSTATIFKNFKGSNQDQRFENLYKGFITNDINEYAGLLFNDLEETVDLIARKSGSVTPTAIQQKLIEAGALGASMTGSGSTVYGLTTNYKDAAKVSKAVTAMFHNFNFDIIQQKRKR